MKRLSYAEAVLAGYRSVTTPINPHAERHLVESIERSMKGCNAVWIIDPHTGWLEAGRQSSEIKRSK